MANKFTIKDFIEKAKAAHGNKYDYSLVNYVNTHTKVKIICPQHGIFMQIPNSHVKGSGCSMCSKNKKLTTEEFIKKAKVVHENKYDYNLTQYIKSSGKLKIFCPEHGVFKQVAAMHLQGQGCPKCNGKNKTTEDFIVDCIKIHGNTYDYSLVNYNGIYKKVKIICPIHGVFEQSPNDHLDGHECCKCKGCAKLTTKEFIERARIIHDNKFDYSLVEYKNYITKVKIICPEHGIFEQIPKTHLKGFGCKNCYESKGEKKVQNFLNKIKIKSLRQYSFKDCRDKLPLPFDFYLPNLNICVEYQGIQHFKPVKLFGGENALKDLNKRDNIKANYCNNKNIKLIIVNYYDSIEDVLLKELSLFL